MNGNVWKLIDLWKCLNTFLVSECTPVNIHVYFKKLSDEKYHNQIENLQKTKFLSTIMPNI